MNQGIESVRRRRQREYAEQKAKSAEKSRKTKNAEQAARMQQARIIPASDHPGGVLVPIRTPTVVFCKKCAKRMHVTDQDPKKSDFIKCPICGTPYPLWYDATAPDRKAGPRATI